MNEPSAQLILELEIAARLAEMDAEFKKGLRERRGWSSREEPQQTEVMALAPMQEPEPTPEPAAAVPDLSHHRKLATELINKCAVLYKDCQYDESLRLLQTQWKAIWDGVSEEHIDADLLTRYQKALTLIQAKATQHLDCPQCEEGG